MTQFNKTCKTICALAFLMVLFMGIGNSVFAVAPGTYTIDSSQVASASNYRSFLAAVSDLRSGTRSDGGTPNGAGVTGAVLFNVAAGTFPGQLDITGITGVSATNTITFDGGAGNASTRIVTHTTATNVATAFTVKINNQQHIHLKNLTITGGSASFAWPLHIFNTSSNVSVRNCIINFTTAPSLHTSTSYCAVVINNSTTSPTSAGTAAINIVLDSNIISGGYGNYILGTGANTGITFSNNMADSSNYYGLYLQSLAQLSVKNNTFNMFNAGNINGMGIYVNSCTPTTGNFLNIEGNKISNSAYYGLYIASSNAQATPRSRVVNNAFGGGFRNTNASGIYITSAYNWDLFNNSVNMDAVTVNTQNAALYIGNCCTQGATLLDVRNNILAVTGIGSTAYPLYMPNGYTYAVIGTSNLDYNNYFKAGVPINDPIIYSGGNLFSAANFVGNGGYNVNSISVNPTFTNARNLMPINGCNNGTSILGITTDANGLTRNNPPDIGAFEVTGVANDIGVEALTSPVAPFLPGNQSISVRIRNYGSNSVTSANVSYQINNGAIVTTTFTGSLAPCATAIVTFSGGNQFNFSANTSYQIKTFTDNPNSLADANTINDTTVVPIIYTGLTGNYTIDQGAPASNTNFVSFTDAVNALNFGGVSGPVVFTVMGTTAYNEQVSLNYVPGVSAVNTITLDGGAGNAANRTITYAANLIGNTYTFRINNTPWVNVQNLTIQGTGLSYAWPLHIMGPLSINLKVRNNIINYTGGGGVNGANDNFTGIVVNASTTSLTTNVAISNLEIDSNVITGGQNGIYIYASNSNNVLMRYNQISNTNQYGMYFYYLTGFKCSYNQINMRATGSTTSMGIYANFPANSGTINKEIIGNVVKDAGQYGINVYYMQGQQSLRNKVVNNVITGTFRHADPAGLYINQSVSYTDIWFNSVNLNNAATGVTSAAFKVMSSVNNIDVRNNNFAVTNPASVAYALYCDASSGFGELNFNNYYKPNPTNLLNISNNILGANNFKGGLGLNNNSVSVNPAYTSATDLHTNLLCNNGVAIAGVTTDFEGDLRATPPDIGADENLNSVNNDVALATVLTPSIPLTAGVQNIQILIKNNGSNVLSSAVVSYAVNGGAPMTQQWNGVLNPCDSAIVEFNATSGAGSTDQRFAFLPGFAYSVAAYTSLPNGVADGNTLNDTVSFGPVCTALSGNYTIDSSQLASTTNFISATSAVLALNCGGVTGPVTFNVAAGTFPGQLTINAITGSSSINTITFDGGAGNDSTRIFTFDATINNARHTVMVNSANYINFKNLTIRGTGLSLGWPVHIMGTSSFVNISNCIVDFTGNGFNGTSTNYIAVVVNGSATSPTTTATFNNITIDNNKIVGGQSGMYIMGNGTNTNIFVRNNWINNHDLYGAQVSNIIGAKVINNKVNMRLSSTTSIGLYFVSNTSNATNFTEIRNNRVFDAGQMGIQLNSCSMTGLRGLMANNSVGGYFRNTAPSGIYLTSSNNWNIVYNTAMIDTNLTGSTACAAMFITGSTGLDCRNNNLAITGLSAGANLLPFRSASGVTFTPGLNYNNYFKQGTPTTLIQVNGTNLTPVNYTTNGGGANSVSNQSGYIGGTKELIPTLATNNGIQVGYTNRDINDSIRNNPPDIGAYEIPSGLVTDLGLTTSLTPDTALSSGNYDVSVVVKNFGATAVTSFNLSHTVNGTAQKDTSITGVNLALNDSIVITMPGAKGVSIAGGTLSTYKIFASAVNAALTADDNRINDTITIGPKLASFRGVYTINPAGSGSANFVSFRSAITALNIAGVSGPVTFMVAAATYNEQVNLGAINGTSVINTITFDGGAGNASTRIIDTTANTTTNYWTVRLNNAPYIKFRNLTIRASGATYGNAVQISGTSDYVAIKNCILTIGGTGATSTSANYIPLLINNGTNITSLTTGIRVNHLEIDSNTIEAGYYGIYAYGLTSTPYSLNNRFRGNTINNSYLYGAYYYYFEGINFSNNNVSLRPIVGNSSYGLYLQTCTNTLTNFHTINANKFSSVNRYGIYITGGGGSARSLLTNNIVGGFTQANAYGIYLSSTNTYDVYHNTVHIDFNTNNAQYASLFISSGSNIDVRNNIFTQIQTATGLPVYVSNTPGGYFILNYNIYHKYTTSLGAGLVYVNNTTYTAANFIGGGGYNLNSVNANPGYVSSTDLHLVNGCVGRAPRLNNALADVDGNSRNLLTNIGADEASGSTNDVGVEQIIPFSAGSQPIRAVVRNYGSNAITSFNIAYSVNGAIPVVIQWSGNLAPCDTATVSFTANPYTFVAGSSYTVEVITSQPNLTADGRTSNDTLAIGPTCVFLSGNYTINASGSGNANFTTFAGAVNALMCGGVSGPVTFNVAPGTYSEQLFIGAIPGSSATNTVIFNGDSAHNRILTFNATQNNAAYTVKIEGATYLTFRNLTISNSGTTYGNAVQISSNSNNIKLQKCSLEIVGTATTSTSSFFIPVLISASTNISSPSTAPVNIYNIEIDSNRIFSGYYGIYMYGQTSLPYSNFIYIRNNVFDSVYYYGLYAQFGDKIDVIGNTLNMRIAGNAPSYGISLNNCYAQGSNIHVIANNRIYHAGLMGIYTYFSYGSLSTSRCRMVNNIIGGDFRSATATPLYMHYSYYWDVWNNTVQLNFPTNSDQNSAAVIANCQLMDIRNNHFIYSAPTGAGIPLNVTTTNQITTLDNNNYFNAATNQLVSVAGVPYNSNNFVGGGTYNTNSRNINPGFASSTNLAPTNGCINGVAIATVTTDILGVTRNNPPDIGAIEFTGTGNNDIGVSLLSSPQIPFTPGNYHITARVNNYGANAVTSAIVKYRINNGAVVSTTYSGNLQPCDFALITISVSPVTFVAGSSYSIKVWTELPNNVSDINALNDTLAVSACPSLVAGTYTINAAGSGPNNFTSFAAAVNTINCGGVSGPVVFNVAPGTYAEQVTLQSVNGTSAINTITFDGGSAATTRLEFNATNNFAAHTFRIANTPFVRVRNLTIVATGASFGNPLHIMGTSDNAQIRNCVMTIEGAGQSSTSSFFIGVLINNDANIQNPTANGFKANNIEVDSNIIRYGYYGVLSYGFTNTPYANNSQFKYNKIDSSYYYGMYFYYNSGLKIIGNNIAMRSGNVNSDALNLSNNYNNTGSFYEISSNKIIGAGRYGIYTWFTSNSSSPRGKMNNNMIGGGFGNSSSSGIYMQYSTYWDIFHNSINLDFPTTSATASAMQVGTSSTDLDIRNNHFVYSATTGVGLPFYSTQTHTQATLNYNNYFNAAAANLLYSNGTTYNTSNYQVAAGINANSVNVNPNFVNRFDLHTGGCVKGVAITSVTNDIDGQTRNSPPDIGADEAVSNDLGIVAITSPVEPVNPGLQNVVIRVRNFGGNTVNTVTVAYNINGTGVVSQTFTGLTLSPCDTTSLVFTGANQFNFPAGRAQFLAYIASVNSVTDNNATNDTIRRSLCGALSGAYTINAAGSGASNFISFADAVTTLACAGIAGPVVFNVAAGTYNEQVTIPSIAGVNATNTITFDGGNGNAATRVLTFAASNTNARHTLRFEGSRYITFRNITVQTTGTSFGWGVQLTNGTNNINLNNCVVNVAGTVAPTSASTNFIAVVGSGSNTSATTQGSMFNINIDSNNIIGGYYGIILYGSTSTIDTNIIVRKNVLTNSYYHAIYHYSNDGLVITKNTVSCRGGGANLNQLGIYVATSTAYSANNPIEITANRITNVTQYGLYLTTVNGLFGAPVKVINNMIGGGFQSNSAIALYINAGSNLDVFHNSVNLDVATSAENNACLYVGSTTTNLNIKNNHFAYTANGQGLVTYFLNAGSIAFGGLNYNNYYKLGATAATNLLYIANYYTQVNYIGGGGFNNNSINQLPAFISPLNLATLDGCLNGDSLGVTTDFEDDVRASYADIGADEVTNANNDIGVIAFTQPTFPLSAGLSDIQVIVKNYGTNPVYQGTVSYKVNNGATVSVSFLDTIQPCDTLLVTFSAANQFNFISGSTYQIKAFTGFPNSANDLNNNNDTLVSPQVCIGMSGTYTINPAGSGPLNYTSFQAALNALQCAGVTAPVTFNVAAATYTEQLVIGTIAGASATNTVTFDGGAGNAATRILTFGATTTNARHTVRFESAKFVEMKNLTIRNTSASWAWPVHIFNGSGNLALRNNIIEATYQPATSTNHINVVVSGSLTSPTTAIRVDSLNIDSNIINGGYASIWNYNTQGLWNSFVNNTLNNPHYYGLYVYNLSELKFKNNNVNMQQAAGNINSVGLYLYVLSSSAGSVHEVTGNKVKDMGQYGMYVYFSSGQANNTSVIANNFVGGGFRNTTSHYGIYVEYSNYWNIYHNTINLDTVCTTQVGALHIQNSALNDVRNNLLAVTYPGTSSLPYYAATFNNTSQLDYNNYYKEGNASTLIYNGSAYSPSNYIGANGQNTNSFSIDPMFVSKYNLHVANGCNNGVVIPSITTDIDGNTRTTPPDVGADEVITGFNNNIGVTALLSPAQPLQSGNQNITVVLSNLGNNLVTNATVSYSINGSSPVSIVYTDSLQPCDTALITFTGVNQYNFIQGQSYTIKAYSSLPNMVADNNLSDDTLTLGPLCPSMSGLYTINASGSGSTNFTSFGAAVSALMCAGVVDDVTFDVANGTYVEQITIPAINGVNDTNRISFIGQSVAGVVLTYGAFSSNNAHTLRINGSPYITFRNITIQSTGNAYGNPVHISGSAHSVHIKKCIIRVAGTGATSTSANFIGVLINGINDIASPATGSLVNNLEIDSNTIRSGYYGIYIYGRTSSPYSNNNVFRGNVIDSSYYYGYYNYFNSALKFNYNQINMRSTTGTTASMGIYLYQCYNNTTSISHEVIGNKIRNAGNYGVNMFIASNSTVARGKFYNNMIGGGFRTNSAYGAYFSNADYWDIYHNSINMDIATSNNIYAALHLTSSQNCNVRNNTLAYTATTGTGLPFYSANNHFGTLNNNNYHNAVATNLVYTNNTLYNATNYIGGSGFNANSFNTATGFINPKDLALNGPNVKGASGLVALDIDGQARLSPPDVGADEFFGLLDVGVFAVDSPTTAQFCGTNRNVIIRLRNYGNQALTSANINVEINGTLQASIPWSGNLAGGATSAQINAGNYSFPSGVFNIAVYTSNPNGLSDSIPLNDTAFKSFNTVASVTPSITLNASHTSICAGSEVTFSVQYTGGGTAPIVQWRNNGITIPNNSDTLKLSTLANGDSIICILTSNATCALPPSVFSNYIKMNVGFNVAPDVTISATSTNICAGQDVTFTANPVNGGTAPIYTWYKNGVQVGGDSSVYLATGLQNNDSVRVVLLTSLGCAVPSRDTSSYTKITVNPVLVPTASITATTTNFCAGTSVIFAATTTNQGTTPVYQWKRNGIDVGLNNDSLQISTLINNDSISVVVTSNAICAIPSFVESAKIGVSVTPLVTPSVSISTTSTNICAGANATFTATPVNAGVNATYSWRVNSAIVGTSSTFSSSTLNNNDTVRLVITVDTICPSVQQVTSNAIVMQVNALQIPQVTVSPSSATVCFGGSATFTATPTNGGTTPSYQWLRNGVAVGIDSVAYNGTFTQNDSIAVILTSSITCLTKTKDTSAYAHVTIGSPVTPSVNIGASATTICAGTNITFTATPTNGGTTPTYQWKRNGTNIGVSNAVQTFSSINNNDTFTVILTTSLGCVTTTKDTSNKIGITVTPTVTPFVTVSASANSICSDGSVTFTANAANEGTAPSYQWKRNGVNIGIDSFNQTFTNLTNNDSIYVVLTSNANCALPTTATSNKQKITVTPSVVPSVSIVANKTSICVGEQVIYTATPVNPGTTPIYQWKVNGANAGTNSNTFTTSTITASDSVSVQLTSNAVCATTPIVLSNKVKLNANPVVIPSISVTSNGNNICAGSSITFVATPTNGGTTPSFQWRVNNTNVGTNNDSLTINTLSNNDSVYVVLTSNQLCAAPSTATSNKTKVTVIPLLTPSVLVGTSASTICKGSSVTYTATATNGGGAPTYIWLNNGTQVGTNSNTYTTSDLNPQEDIVCILVSSEACVTKGGDTTLAPGVTVNFPPAKPVVVKVANDSLTTAFVSQSYQWFKDGVIMAGATTRGIKLTANGSYTVRADSLTCNTLSDALTVTSVGLKDVGSIANVQLYPNPTKGYANLMAEFTGVDQTELVITDMYGKLISTTNLGNINRYEGAVNLNELADGVYFIQVKHGTDVLVKRVVKAN